MDFDIAIISQYDNPIIYYLKYPCKFILFLWDLYCHELFSINTNVLYSEKVVAKNCAINRNENFTLDDLKIIIIAIVLPISSASCERSFSAMHRIKTRSTMEQSRFTNISLLHIERDTIIDSEQVLINTIKRY
ncbi:zinc finger MYM-type protein 1-like [Aphis craccivora]|uniref:Zinc finger MYM-type protein 1-like n=1 Tax=Aphis craccivora TaxID=307492 RepID=A0A6G0YQS0_APHCR|nr:zinc finger MYM-type protein 1-like [Aphis craccivora]